MHKHMIDTLSFQFAHDTPVRRKPKVWPPTLKHLVSITLLCTTNQCKTFTFGGTIAFQTKLAGNNLVLNYHQSETNKERNQKLPDSISSNPFSKPPY